MFTYFEYDFFVRAILVGTMASLVLSWLSGYIVLRREVLFTHSISHAGFLGIALALVWEWSTNWSLILASLIAVFIVDYLKQKYWFDSDSILAMIAQITLAVAIIVISSISGYQINIEQFLFGDILGINKNDIWITIGLLLGVAILVITKHTTFLKISLSSVLSHTTVKHKKLWHSILMVMIAGSIALAMKIIGVLLVASFTTLPANIAKLIAPNLQMTFVISTVLGVFATVVGLMVSTVYDTPSGPMIVIVLAIVLGITVIAKSVKKCIT